MVKVDDITGEPWILCKLPEWRTWPSDVIAPPSTTATRWQGRTGTWVGSR